MQRPMIMKSLLPTRALALLMVIGFADLLATAVLHERGLIHELNPLMRVLIERSEWLFAVVNSLTLVVAWVVMARYAERNLPFVRKCCIAGSAAYVSVWLVWFTSSL